jgi:HPt (histidine-containing phosphotransfer) domain-containing protein
MESSQRIRVLISPDFEDYMPIYIENRHKDLAALTQALEEQDWDFIRQTGHRMTGSGASFGLDFISELGQAFEHLPAPPETAPVQELLRQFAHYLESLDLVYDHPHHSEH